MSIQTKDKSFSEARDALISNLQILAHEEKISKGTYDILFGRISTMNHSNITIDDVIAEVYEKGDNKPFLISTGLLVGRQSLKGNFIIEIYKL